MAEDQTPIDTTLPAPTDATNRIIEMLRSQMGGMGDPKTQADAFALYAANAKAPLDRQKEVERTSSPFPKPGEAMKTNNLAAEERGYAPSGTIFTGGVPYKPNYEAQNTAAAGMLLSNLMEAYAKNNKAWSDSQGTKP